MGGLSKLFIMLVKKFGFKGATKIAPKFGISKQVIDDTAIKVNQRFEQGTMGSNLTWLMSSPGGSAAERISGIAMLKKLGRRNKAHGNIDNIISNQKTRKVSAEKLRHKRLKSEWDEEMAYFKNKMDEF
jgi:hypothetical protein